MEITNSDRKIGLHRHFFLALVIVFLASCGRITATPQPVPTTDPHVVETQVAATVFARLTATAPPQATGTMPQPTSAPIPMATDTQVRAATVTRRAPTLPIPTKQPIVPASPTPEFRAVRLKNTLLLFQDPGQVANFRTAIGSLDTNRNVRISEGELDQYSLARKIKIEVTSSYFKDGMLGHNTGLLSETLLYSTVLKEEVGRLKAGITIPARVVEGPIVVFECWVSEQAWKDATQ